MSLLHNITGGLRTLFRKRQTEQEMDEELRAYVETAADENRKAGMSRAEALRAARLQAGSLEHAKENVRAAGWESIAESLLQDVRFGARMLRKNPGFTAVAVLTLALGIGATVAIFTVVNEVLIRPLPFKNPSRLMMLWEGIPKMGFPKLGFSAPDFAYFEANQDTFESIGAFQNKEFDISGHGQPERVMAARVSASIFPMLGREVILGRTFTSEEDAPGHNVALLSYGLWQGRYGGDKGIVGQTIELDREAYTVVGIMGSDFVFPLPGPVVNHDPADLWIPMAFTPVELQGWGSGYNTDVIARLKPDVTVGEARSQGATLSQRLMDVYPPAFLKALNGDRVEISVDLFQQEIAGQIRTPLLVLGAAVALLLLIACANVAILLLSRATARQREIAIRASLGATQARLLRQLLTESLLLAACGGGLGFVLAILCKNILLSLTPREIPLPQQIPVGSDVIFFALVVSVLTTFFFGAIPAFQVSVASLRESLQEGGRGATVGRTHHRLQAMFVAADFALALILLVGAGLLTRSFTKLIRASLGFRPEHVLTLSLPLPHSAYPQAAQVRELYANLLQRFEGVPGITAAGLSSDLPLESKSVESFEAEHQGVIETMNATPATWVSGNYFPAQGMSLLRGRWFTEGDSKDSQRVLIISQALAQRYWPSEDPLGKRIRQGSGSPWLTIVGVVGDVNDRMFDRPIPARVYMPYLQVSDRFLEMTSGEFRSMNVAVRTEQDPGLLTRTLVDQVHSVDPDLAVAHIRTMTQVVSSSVAGPKFNTWVLGILASVALLLASVGIYGLMAYISQQRTQEIGIRMAFGAQRGGILKMVLWEGTRLALAGTAVGAVGALALTRFLSSLLYGVNPTDPVTFVGVIALLLSVALLACYLPARRATKVDPTVALRYE